MYSFLKKPDVLIKLFPNIKLHETFDLAENEGVTPTASETLNGKTLKNCFSLVNLKECGK